MVVMDQRQSMRKPDWPAKPSARERSGAGASPSSAVRYGPSYGWAIGCTVRFTTTLGDEIEGTVFAYDKLTSCLTLTEPGDQPGLINFRVVKTTFIREVLWAKRPTERLNLHLPYIDVRKFMDGDQYSGSQYSGGYSSIPASERSQTPPPPAPHQAGTPATSTAEPLSQSEHSEPARQPPQHKEPVRMGWGEPPSPPPASRQLPAASRQLPAASRQPPVASRQLPAKPAKKSEPALGPVPTPARPTMVLRGRWQQGRPNIVADATDATD